MTQGKYHAKTDANQQDIIDGLRNAGATVQSLHAAGEGVPDLLVGYMGINLLIEVKMFGKKLNARQVKWFSTWDGQAEVATTPQEAVRLIENVYQDSLRLR